MKKMICMVGILLMMSFSFVLTGCVEQLSREEAIPDDAVKMTPETDPFKPIVYSDEWMQPVPMPGPINTAGAEDAPVITPDGNTFFFFFTPDVSIPANEQLTDGVTGIWWSKKTNGIWSEPERVLLTTSIALDGPLCIHDNTLWFCSARVGNYRDLDIYTAELVNGKWKNWKNVGELLNEVYEVGELYLTADGNTMYFDSSRDGGYGKKDIWMIEKDNDVWSEPVNLGPTINDENDQGWLYVTQDGMELWYGAEGGIYRSMKNGSSWDEPELIVTNFVGDPGIDDEGNLYFTHHYFSEEGTHIEADIYVAYHT